jgi:putative membrane protein
MIAISLTLLLAAIHVYIMVVEMFLRGHLWVRAAFGTSPEFAKASKVLGAGLARAA